MVPFIKRFSDLENGFGSVEINNMVGRFHLNAEVFIYGMSSRSLHTVKSFRINDCNCVIVISIFL